MVKGRNWLLVTSVVLRVIHVLHLFKVIDLGVYADSLQSTDSLIFTVWAVLTAKELNDLKKQSK